MARTNRAKKNKNTDAPLRHWSCTLNRTVLDHKRTGNLTKEKYAARMAVYDEARRDMRVLRIIVPFESRYGVFKVVDASLEGDARVIQE